MEHVHCIENTKHQLLTRCLNCLHLNNVQVTLASSKNVQVTYKFMQTPVAFRQGRRQNQYACPCLARSLKLEAALFLSVKGLQHKSPALHEQ